MVNAAIKESPSRMIVRGVCPVIETPFTARGQIDIDSFENLAEHLLSVGVRTVMFPGFASEYYKLDDKERDILSRTLIGRFHTVPDGVVVTSVTDHATIIATQRARDAIAAGADMVNILPPHQLKPGAQAVRQHIGAVLDAVAPHPAIVQYAPEQTGTALDAQILADMSVRWPNLNQVKVESTPPGKFISAIDATGAALTSVVGYAGVQMIDALRRGAVGVQPGSSFVEIYLQIWKLWQAGGVDDAIQLHGRLLPYISYWMQEVELIIRAEKRISQLRGLIASDYCRAPSRVLDAEENAMIDRFLSDFAELLGHAT